MKVDVAMWAEFARDLLLQGKTVDQVVDLAVELADGLADWNVIVGGKIGALLEAKDGPTYRAVLRFIVRAAARALDEDRPQAG